MKLNSKKIIISQPWGGLGDNLQFSTLPELYDKLGYEVYVSNNNKVRNKEIYDLVWGENPYVKGVIDDNEGTVIGSNSPYKWPNFKENYYFIQRIEIAHGHNPTNVYPKIYYNSKFINEYNDYTLIDISNVSNQNDATLEKIKNYIIQYIKNNNIFSENIKVIGFKNNISKNNNIDKFPDYNVFYINNIYEYCDALNSCKNFLTLTSGAHVMASAIKNNNSTPNIICWIPWNKKSDEEEKGFYCFPNVKYYDINNVDVL